MIKIFEKFNEPQVKIDYYSNGQKKYESWHINDELHNLDERRSERRALDCCATVNYPYAKTETGALQLPKMPWQYKNESKNYFFGSLISLVLGASIF